MAQRQQPWWWGWGVLGGGGGVRGRVVRGCWWMGGDCGCGGMGFHRGVGLTGEVWCWGGLYLLYWT